MKHALTLTAAVLVFAAMAAPALAQPKPAEADAKSHVVLSWEEFVKITGFDPAKKGGPQVLTIPWAEVESLLGVKVEQVGKAATVDLPWAEFKALLEWSVNRKAPKPEGAPPTDYIITSTEYAGALSADGATFTLKAKLEILRKEGWKRIPILPANVAVSKATLPAGMYLNSASGRYELLTSKDGAMDVTIEFAVAPEKTGGINRVNFQPVTPGSAVLDLTIDRENVDVKVPGAQSLAVKSADGKTTHVAAAIPSGMAVDITWERALPKVAAAPTKLYSETRTLVSVAEGVLLCQETVYFNILHTAVRELKLTVPKGASVLEVAGPNVQDWRVDDKGELLVVMRGEVIGSYVLRIAYERSTAGGAEVPVIRAAGVEREKGYIGVVALANVEIGAGKVTGATEIDVRQLPADITAMTNQPILLGFRYVEEAFAIPLTIKKHEAVGVLVTIVDSALYTAMQLNDGRRMTKVVYSVRNNRNQFLRLAMPPGVDIWSVSVSGNMVSPAKDEKGAILIPLVRSKTGGRELASFPVEIVYVATPDKVAPARGTLNVTLPELSEPVIHVMFNLYLPAEGQYTIGWGKSGFTGVLRLVENFTSLSAGPGAEVIEKNIAAQVGQMQQEVDLRVDAEAKAVGATPIRVRLPINGKLFKLEKILALPSDKLFFNVEYRNWEVAK